MSEVLEKITEKGLLELGFGFSTDNFLFNMTLYKTEKPKYNHVYLWTRANTNMEYTIYLDINQRYPFGESRIELSHIKDFLQLRAFVTQFKRAMHGCEITEVEFEKDYIEPEQSVEPEKPILGLKPKSVVKLERLTEIRLAIKRYFDAGLSIPLEWIEEHNELNGEFEL